TKSSDWWEEDNYTVSIRVLEVVRGDEIKKHRKDVITDDKPDSGFEFMLVKIAFSVVDTKGDFSIDANKYSFTPFTSNNEETEQAYLDMSVNDEFNWLSGQ
ncbi:MAG: hypothetical protein IK072_05360, partial [Clostridia bacterium]|nr:hypothetical protein [Clostridia bacterium]